MRLGQLSRKLEIKSQEITSFIEREFNETINNHPNCKIADEYIEKIVAHFGKEIEIEPEESPVIIIEQVESISVPEPEEVDEIDEEIEAETEITHDSSLLEEDDDDDQTVELNEVDGVIKAPKVEMAGVKVIGKIDLPEPKLEIPPDLEEESTEENAESIEETTVTETDLESKKTGETVPPPPTKPKTEQPRNQPRSKPSRRKVIDYKEEERRKIERYEKKKEAEAKRKKLKGKKHYQQHVLQQNLKPTTAKAAKKKQQQKSSSNTNQLPAPKTLWGKFMRWLNT